MAKPNWWNGRLVGIATLLGGAAVLVAWGTNDWFQSQAAHHWDSGWPQLQVTLLLAVAVLTCREAHWRKRVGDMDKAKAAAVAEAQSEWSVERTRLLAQIEAPDADALEADRTLYRRLLDLLPSDGGTMWFVKEHPFDISYEDGKLNDLRVFLHEWDIAHRHFHDAEVEAARSELHAANREFVMHLATHSFQRDDNDRYRIYPDVNLDWETESNAFAIQAAQEANRLSWALWEKHQAFVEIGKRRLRL